MDFGTPWGRLLRPKSLKMGGCYFPPAVLDSTWKLFLHKTPPKTPNGTKMEPKWTQNGSKMEPKRFQTGPKMNLKWSQKGRISEPEFFTILKYNSKPLPPL